MNKQSIFATFLLLHSQDIVGANRMLIDQESFEDLSILSNAEVIEGLNQMSMASHMNQLESRHKSLLKTHVQVDVNEYLQEKLDSELFEDLDEDDKARFIGSFFKWVKSVFAQRSNTPNYGQTQFDALGGANRTQIIENKKELAKE